MTRIFAHIALFTLLAGPCCNITSSILGTNILKAGYELTLPDDVEDTEDDSLKETRTLQQCEAMMTDLYSTVTGLPSVRLKEAIQLLLFNEHHLEVRTPPPRG